MSTRSQPSSPAALRRWSCVNTRLPGEDPSANEADVETIQSIHVYDFDNTLFNSPLPNAQLWNGPTIGALQNEHTFKGGGWWHDPDVLSSTGEGLDKEEPRAWEGWWNETIVELVRLSMEQRDALAVLLTGRSERSFSELIPRIVKSKSLKFDMVVLKPEVGLLNEKFPSTMSFKQTFLTHLLETYTKIEDFKIYEDRPKHVEGFEAYLKEFSQKIPERVSENTNTVQFEVIPVAPSSRSLEPLTETVQVQKMVDHHNEALQSREPLRNARLLSLKSQVLFSGYLINPEDSERLLTIANLPEEGLHTLANTVMISSRSLTDALREKVGGLGAKLRWKVTSLGMYDNKVWAARVEPVPITAPFYVDSQVPSVVLARRALAKPSDAWRIQNWSLIPPDKQIEFDTVVGEKVLLRLDQDMPPRNRNNYKPVQVSQGQKRPLPPDSNHAPPRRPESPRSNEHRPPRGGAAPHGQHHPRGGPSGRSGRGGGSRGGRGQGRAGHGGPRGGRRGGHNAPYRSLDEDASKRMHGMDGGNDDVGLTY